MKKLFTIALVLCAITFAKAQTIKSYLAIVKTDSGKVKGILYTANPDYLVVDDGNGFKTVKMNIVRSVKIRMVKKGYEVKKLVSHDINSDGEFERGPNGQMVRKWGTKEPTVGDQVWGAVGGTFFNVIGNMIAAPIHAINPSLAYYKFQPTQPDSAKVQSLSYYSIQYQQNPSLVELPKL
ncbi:hypothetical protein [Pedobacter gandavensis]|uniref:hypothetical protein n=1 Tax=Pedobacter gandavensis TaxID=2679963 RepID=UPI00292DAAB2|nr:hypothetical protein [Pedobacter gandavensis]